MKILWALDAFEDLQAIQKNQVEIIKTFAKRGTVEVDPVYVLGPSALNLTQEFAPQLTDVYAPAALKALTHKLKEIGPVPGLRDPQVLIQRHPSLKGAADLLCQAAAKGEHDLILVGSHGRRGFQRLVLGSFAEEILLQAATPVLIVGAAAAPWKDRAGALQVMLANDLTDERAAILSKTLDFAKALDARVTLLTALPRPIEPVFQSGVYLLSGGWVAAPQFLEREQRKLEEVARSFQEKALARGVPCEWTLDTESSSVTDAVLKHAQSKNVSVIAMAAESGKVDAMLLGSITRQVARMAPCPVWVYRTKR